MFEGVRRIVRGADHHYFEMAKDGMSPQILRFQLGIGLLPDFGSGILIDEEVYPEIPLKFEVAPMIERVAQGIGNGAAPSQVFFVRIRLPGTIGLPNPIAAHGPPLVVIPFQPDFGQVLKLPVRGHVLRGKVAMIVANGLIPGVLVEKPAGRIALQEKIIVDKCHI